MTATVMETYPPVVVDLVHVSPPVVQEEPLPTQRNQAELFRAVACSATRSSSLLRCCQAHVQPRRCSSLRRRPPAPWRRSDTLSCRPFHAALCHFTSQDDTTWQRAHGRVGGPAALQAVYTFWSTSFPPPSFLSPLRPQRAAHRLLYSSGRAFHKQLKG